MPRHDDFEKICAAASLGKATAEDLAKLERHVVECPGCWQAYHDHVSVAALKFAVTDQDLKLTQKEARECLDSDLFTRRWFDRAEREGIAFSEEVPRPPARIQQRPSFPLSPALLWRQYGTPIAVAALVLLVVSTGYLYRRPPSDAVARNSQSLSAPPTHIANRPTNPSASNRALEASDRVLKVKVDHLSHELADAEEKLRASETSAQMAIAQERKNTAADRELLQAQVLHLRTQLLQGQTELAELQTVAANAQREAEEQHKRAGDLETTLVAAQAELNDVTSKAKLESAALGRERELLAMGRDVSDLMGARNLHILDVVDTDTRGQTRPAFGRIFFTEGKSLVFYAYDLNEAKIQKANYQYQIWAKKEGPNRPARRLGIFYSDDKAQNRWVFKCDDANIVKEIDSVFVTVGRPNSDPSRPEGSRLMFAYLHGAPNHP